MCSAPLVVPATWLRDLRLRITTYSVKQILICFQPEIHATYATVRDSAYFAILERPQDLESNRCCSNPPMETRMATTIVDWVFARRNSGARHL